MANLPIMDNPQFAETMEQVTAQDRAAPDTFNPRYQTLLDNDNYLKGQVERLERTAVVDLPAAGWSAAAPYSQRVAVPGLKETDNPELHPYTPRELAAADVKQRQKLAGMITDGDTEDGYATFYCGVKKPTADFPILLKGVSANG